jgi:hypothetical protein
VQWKIIYKGLRSSSNAYDGPRLQRFNRVAPESGEWPRVGFIFVLWCLEGGKLYLFFQVFKLLEENLFLLSLFGVELEEGKTEIVTLYWR